MPAVHHLPSNPHPDQLRQQARALQRAVQAGDPGAAARVHRQHPDGVPADPAAFHLSAAQLVVAREYGFASWPRLRQYLDLVAAHGWDASPPDRAEDSADEFCRLACLTYDEDDPQRRARARRLLAERPGLAEHHIWAAAAAAEPDTVRRLVAEDPGRARLRGGPYRWAPLCYLAYSRLDPGVPAEPVLAVARLLLDAGADPDEGYLWNGRPYPFTLLTGVFGDGELGPERQPPHPHAHALARLLLAAGANPNDSQTLYNRQFRPDDEHLALLFEYGLGRGETYPWRERLGDLLDRPGALLRAQLRWAVEHDFRDRVRLLARHGADLHSRFPDGQTAAEVAARCGNASISDYLVAQGMAPPALDPAGELTGAALRGDRSAVELVRSAHPEAPGEACRAHPGLMVWAAADGRTEAVVLLAELGFDVNTLGRGDTPSARSPWETPLHQAAATGNVELARLLLSLGADPDRADCRFGATPLGWAQHFDQAAMIELLTPLTRTAGG